MGLRGGNQHLDAVRMGLPGGVFLANPDAIRYPVYCPDIGRALAACVRDDKAPGSTFELIGYVLSFS